METLVSLFAVLLLISVCWSSKTHLTRQIHKEVYKVTCPHKKTIHIIHETATSTSNKDDVIHYLWSAINRPTLVIKHVFKPTTLDVNNQSVCNRKGAAFKFSPDNSDISGLVLTKVYAYNDPDGDVAFAEILDEIAGEYTWEYLGDKEKDVATFNGTTKNYPNNGSMEFKVQAHAKTTNAAEWPHNPINANLTEFSLTLDKLPGYANAVHLRYAVEIMFFTTGDLKVARYDTKKYIDDEYTPGIFNIWSVDLLPDKKKTYASWKPVSYDDPERSRKTQIFARNHGAGSKLDESGSFAPYTGDVAWSIVEGLAGVKFYGVNVTFGTAKEDVYNGGTSLISWVGMVGSGTPPCDSLSGTTLAILVSGLGAPGVVILIAIFVLLIRKVRLSRRSNYDQIN